MGTLNSTNKYNHWTKTCLIQSTVVNRENYHFEFQNSSSDAKIMKCPSEDSLTLSLIPHALLIVFITEHMLMDSMF